MSTYLFPETAAIFKRITSDVPKYNENMTSNELIEIAIQYMKNEDYNNMKKCYMLAITKKDTNAMITLGNFYQKVEINLSEMIRLYTLAYENGNKVGVISLVNYYKSINNIPNAIKYLNICIERFDDTESMEQMIRYYLFLEENTNNKNLALKYCDLLITYSPNNGYFMKGYTFQKYSEYELMKIQYDKFISDIDKSNLIFNKKNCTKINYNFLYVIKFYMDNEINLKLIQNVLGKCNNVPKYITGHMQYKINKSKYINPPYNKIDMCPCCLEVTNLQLFDCGGHWHCQNCTIKISQCSECACYKSCSHI